MLIQPLPTRPHDDWRRIVSVGEPTDGIFDFSALDLSNYQRIVVLVERLTTDADPVLFNVRLYVGGQVLATGYRYRTRLIYSSSTLDEDASSSSATSIIVTNALSGTSPRGFSARIEISNVSNSLYKLVNFDAMRTTSFGEAGRNVGGGIAETTGTVDGIILFPSPGTFTAGRVTVYGLSLGSRTPAPVSADLMSMWVGGLT